MKILFAGQSFYRNDNGQAVFTIHLAEGLARAGHDVLVLAPSDTGRSYRRQQSGINLQTVPALDLGHNLNVTALTDRLVSRIMVEFQPQIVHLQDHYFLSRSVLRAAKQRQLPVVGTNHFLPENLSENFRIPDQWRDMVGRLLWRNMLAVYNQLVAVTTPTQTGVAILRQQSLQVPVQAISCGVDTVRFRLRPDLDRDEVRRKYGLALDKNIFLYLGRVDREKRVEVVVNAMANLQVEQVQFVVAGKGRYLADVQHLCRSLGLGQRVICVGFVPEEDLPLLLNSVDAFVMPSQAELQSISTLEAMSSGLPVLAANARALPELVTDGVNGYLMAPGDVADTRRGILTMLSNRFRWAEMGATSRAKALVHAHENSVQRYSDWYKQVILQRIPTSVALQVSRQEV